MEKLVESGRVRSIGVSNFNIEETKRLLSNGKIKPVANQVECSPRKNQKHLIAFSARNNVTIVAHTPLGRPSSPNDNNSPISNPKVLALAQKYQKSPAKIILRFLVHFSRISSIQFIRIFNGPCFFFRTKMELLLFQNPRKRNDWKRIWTFSTSLWTQVTWKS